MNLLYNCFVVNPVAGKGGGKEALIGLIRSACEKRGEKYEIYVTESRGDATRFVRAACEQYPERATRFYSCGGDGTLNEVTNGACGYDNAQVAAIPAGTGNDFIKSFSSLPSFSDIECQLDGEPMKVDLIKFGNKYCMNLLNIGFDCTVVEKMKKLRSKVNVPNNIAYPLGVLSALFGVYGQHFSVTFDDDKAIEKDFLLSAFGNGRIYGGGYTATPLACIDDGILDVCLVDKISRFKFISLIGDYKKGTHILREKPIEFLSYHKCKRVHFESPVPIGVCFDGEVENFSSLDIEIVPEAVSFAVPRGSVCLCSSKKDEKAYAPETEKHKI